ncbi:hypothetical protein [Thalassiella azotivora]
MSTLVVLCVFVLMGVATLLAAVTGYRGHVCTPGVGYSVPPDVRHDPELCRRANELVAFWCTGATIMSLPPVVLVLLATGGGGDDGLTLPMLIFLAAYGTVVTCIALHPFEKIKHLGRASESR